MTNNISQPEPFATLGTLLLDAGKISVGDVDRIVTYQKQKGMLFGNAAKALGLINDADIQKTLSLQFDFPFLAESEENFSRELFAAYQPLSSQAENLRAVRGELKLRWFNDTHKALALVSPGRNEGRSYLVANLAIAFSQLGERTLLIDADLRQPRQHTLFKLQGDYGLSDALAGRTDLMDAIRSTALQNLSVLPAGTVPPNPGELISRSLKNSLQQLQMHFDVILIDTSAAEAGMDAQIAALYCGGAMLVARQHETKLDALKRLKEALQGSDTQCLGAVLTDF
jgi:protein-tyrosine kinase